MKVNLLELEGNNSHCFGCTACSSICPVNAIAMDRNEEGFLVPIIDEKKCILCGRCSAVCPAIHKWEKREFNNNVFAIKNKNEKQLKISTSGGVFGLLVLSVLQEGGEVCGCILDSELQVKHIISNTMDDIQRMYGSKYVQSDIGSCFKAIEKRLKVGKKVVFSGTSCQVHGLLNYLKNKNVETNDLITVDLVCHGVPSQKLFNDFIDFYEMVNKEKVKDFYFRSKKYGWGTFLEQKNYIHTVVSETGKEDDLSYCGQLWKNVFFSDFFIRESCYSCPYTCVGKPADITLGDFWGIEYLDSNIEYSKGCSMALPNTDKGKIYLEKIEAEKQIFPCDVNILKVQKRLFSPINRPKNREKIWEKYRQNGFPYVAKHFLRYTLKYKMKYYIKVYMQKYGMERIANIIIGNIFY